MDDGSLYQGEDKPPTACLLAWLLFMLRLGGLPLLVGLFLELVKGKKRSFSPPRGIIVRDVDACQDAHMRK